MAANDPCVASVFSTALGRPAGHRRGWFFCPQCASRGVDKLDIRFDGRVAVVTGAGAGLGRSHALLLASRGARVVVNDLGGNPDGTGSSDSAADLVVKEILEAGGEAVANHDSVATPEGGAAIIQTAIDAYDTVDIVINNAGILRDKSFAKLEPADLEAIIDVHLKGAFFVSQPAFRAMKEKGYGRFVHTTSAAG